jgi:DMSO reductase anchor subunit
MRIETREPNSEEVFYFELAEEVRKKTLPASNDILRQLLTLSVALTGGSLAIFRENMLPTAFRIPVVVSFLVAVIIGLLSVFPITDIVQLNSVPDIKRSVTNVLWWKKFQLRTIAFFLVSGLLLATLGVIFQS